MAGPDESIVRHHIGGIEEGDLFADPQELADAFCGPVFVPHKWPSGTTSPRYLLSLAPPSPAPLPRHYRIVVDYDDGRPSPFVRGATRTGSQAVGGEGWVAVTELASWQALARSDGQTAQVLIERGDHRIDFVSFPTVEDAVESALSLWRYDPTP